MSDLNILIEAYLFWRNEPVSVKKLSEIFSVEKEKIREEIIKLKEKFVDRGVVLLEKGDISNDDFEVAIGISSVASDFIEKITKEELSKELSKAALETLSIVLYKGPVKRSEIDYIRGVNSQFILRHLEIRGLIEKVESKNDGRAYEYKPTFELLAHLGITNEKELPEYDVLRQAVENFENENNDSKDETMA